MLKKVIMYLPYCKPINTPPLHYVVASLCLFFFFLWSCLNSHLALPLSSSRSSTKQGAWGVFTHFPSPLSYTLITGLELLDNAESVTFFSLLSSCFTWESDSSPVSSCTYTWWPFHLINYFCLLKKKTKRLAFIVQRNCNELKCGRWSPFLFQPVFFHVKTKGANYFKFWYVKEYLCWDGVGSPHPYH